MNELQNTMNAMQIGDPMKGAREALKALQFKDPMKEYLATIKAMQIGDPMKGARDALKALQFLDPVKDYLASLRATQLHGVMGDINSVFKASNIDSLLNKVSRSEWPLAYAAIDGNIVVNGDSTVTMDSTTLSCSEIQQIANEIADKAFDRSPEQLEYVINTLVAEIRGLKTPVLEKIISLFFLPIIVALIFSYVNPTTDFHIKESLGGRKTRTRKENKKACACCY
jgi:hypothetical protein